MFLGGGPPEQRGVRHGKGGKESNGAAALQRPRRARRAGESVGGSKQCQNAPHSSLTRELGQKLCYFSKRLWIKIIP